MLKTHVNLIICSEVLFNKIKYVECLLHALLNYLIFEVIFSKNCFSKNSPFFRRFLTGFTGISPVGHVIPTGRFPTGPDR